jgi:hypothetical protein
MGNLDVGDIVTFSQEHDGLPPGTPFAVALVPLTAAQRKKFEEHQREQGEKPQYFIQKELQA